MLWLSDFSCTNINTIFFRQILTFVHDRCLWLGEPIPITDMLIHWITLLPYQGVDPIDAFGGKTKEKQLAYQMKSEFGLVKNSHGYSIHSISDPAVQFVVQIWHAISCRSDMRMRFRRQLSPWLCNVPKDSNTTGLSTCAMCQRSLVPLGSVPVQGVFGEL